MQVDILNIITKVLAEIPFNHLLGLKLDALETDRVVMSFSMKNQLIGNYVHGILHGGVISSVLDMAGGVAVMVAAIQKRSHLSVTEIAQTLSKASTINLHIDFIGPGKGENFVATARVLKAGNKISFANMQLHNEENILIANGAGTYLIT